MIISVHSVESSVSGYQGEPGAFPRPGALHGIDAAVAFDLRNPGMEIGGKAEKIVMEPYFVFRTAAFHFRSAAGTDNGVGMGKIDSYIEALFILGEIHQGDMPGM